MFKDTKEKIIAAICENINVEPGEVFDVTELDGQPLEDFRTYEGVYITIDGAASVDQIIITGLLEKIITGEVQVIPRFNPQLGDKYYSLSIGAPEIILQHTYTESKEDYIRINLFGAYRTKRKAQEHLNKVLPRIHDSL